MKTIALILACLPLFPAVSVGASAPTLTVSNGTLGLAITIGATNHVWSSAVVQLSAAFNAFEFPHGETYTGKMTIHAFAAETATNGSLRAASTWDESCLAAASTGPTRLDRNPATWQRMTTDLRLPANTDFVMIHLMIPAAPRTHTQAGFDGHYIDDVRLTLRHSPLR